MMKGGIGCTEQVALVGQVALEPVVAIDKLFLQVSGRTDHSKKDIRT